MDEKRSAICALMDFYAGALSPRQREVLELYYYEDLSLAEIAENVGITRQGVRDALKHGEEALNNLEEALGVKKRAAFIAEKARSIIELTDDCRIKTLANDILSGHI